LFVVCSFVVAVVVNIIAKIVILTSGGLGPWRIGEIRAPSHTSNLSFIFMIFKNVKDAKIGKVVFFRLKSAILFIYYYAILLLY